MKHLKYGVKKMFQIQAKIFWIAVLGLYASPTALVRQDLIWITGEAWDPWFTKQVA